MTWMLFHEGPRPPDTKSYLQTEGRGNGGWVFTEFISEFFYIKQTSLAKRVLLLWHVTPQTLLGPARL